MLQEGVADASYEGERPELEKVMNPRTIAVVGISDSSRFGDGARRTMANSDAEFFWIHPTAETVMGEKTYPDLLALGRPVDAVFTAVSAGRMIDVVEQAGQIGAGGIITIAGGFAELGEDGVAAQRRVLELCLAAKMPLIGPNGVGLINVPKKLDLTMLSAFERRTGGLSAAMHSGAMIESLAASAWRAGGVGFNLLVSAGNEAVTDLADYLDYFANDEQTKVIALVVEKVRRPDAFFEAARRCLEAGKPIVAIKLAKSERSRRMAASHTGTLTSDAWVYDVAFRQAGIQFADDIDDLANRVQFLEQLPSERWSPVRGLSVVTGTGGFSQLSADLAESEGLEMPEAESLRPFVEANIPGGSVPNPLDTTGFVASVEGLGELIWNTYVEAPEFDTFLHMNQFAEWDTIAVSGAEMFARLVGDRGKTAIVGPLAGPGGSWLDPYRDQGIGVGNGLHGSLRGISTMGRFVRTRKDSRVHPASEVAAIPRPTATPIAVAEGLMLPFAATMELLRDAGVPVADYHLVGPDEAVTTPPFAGPYVVKLADVAHRTEHGAVRVGVDADGLAAAVDDLRAIAGRDDLPPLVAVQPMLKGFGEAFIGVQGTSELGPVVAFGLGGVFVEVLRRIGGRMAPMSAADAQELIAEFDDLQVMNGFRGAPPWDRDRLGAVLVAASGLAAGGRDWIDTVDINPLVVTAEGPVAVDGLCLLRPA
jgi:acyl-CoA synthetase (NDP forming)